jgi:hypothetical protein
MKKVLVTLAFVGVLVSGQVVLAADTLVFDSTDRYIGACALTDTSTWTLPADIAVTTFEVWYRWNTGETELPVTVTRDGQPFATFTAVRGSCDPYQQSWCNADFALNRTMPAGTYTTKIPNARQCLKPGGTGAIRLYSAGADAPVPTAGNVQPTPVVTDAAERSTCGGSTTTYVLGLIAVLEFAVIYFWLIKPKIEVKR